MRFSLGHFLAKYYACSTGNLRNVAYEKHLAEADLSENRLEPTSPITAPSVTSHNSSLIL